jgi:hypothetical protein
MNALRARSALAGLLALTSASCGGNGSSTGVDTDEVVTISVTPSTATLASIGDTLRLTATAKNAAGQPVTAAFTWASSAPAVASVTSDGRVGAASNGPVDITATADGITGTASLSVAQVVASLEAVSGDAQGGDVLSELDSLVTVRALDARGNAAVERTITFTVSEGGGSTSAAEAVTDAEGLVSVAWTLGATVGAQLLTAAAGGQELSLSALAYPLRAAEIRYVSGSIQEELYGFPLPEPLVVQVVDSLGNGVPDVPVHFSIVGAGTLSTDSVVTDLDGIASVDVTNGYVFGRDTIFAEVRDSVVEDIVDFPGSPVRFWTRALGLFVDAIPPTVHTGDTVTLVGQGFAPDPAGMPITIGGLAAPVIAGTQREVTFIVPDFGCSPEAVRWMETTRDTFSIRTRIPVVPREQLALEIGERHIYAADDDGCVQLPGGTDTEYLVGLTSTRWLDAAATFSMSAYDSIGTLPDPQPGPMRVAGPTLRTFGSTPTMEARLRTFEAEKLDAVAPALSGPVLVPPVVGETRNLRLPDLLADPCVDYSDISAEVIWVGPRLAVSSTVDIPPLLLATIQTALNTLSSTLGQIAVGAIVDFLGLPADWDADSRVHVVLTPGLEAMGVTSFSSAVDQLPRTSCPSSDEGRYVYVGITDAASILDRLDGIGPRLAHDITHIIQAGRRIEVGGAFLPAWLAEGQAQAAVERAGLAVAGLSSQADLAAGDISGPVASAWLADRLDRLALYQGWDGAAGQVADAPESCSLYGFTGSHVSCNDDYTGGAAWSLMRYLSDRFGGGDETAFQQALLEATAGSDPVATLEALAGEIWEELLVDWAAALYVDGRLTPAQAPDLQLASWDLTSIFPAGPKRLTPTAFDFTDFTRSGSVLGGGTVYSLIGSGSAHSPVALSIHDGTGGPVAEELRTRLWVVRIR